MFNFAKHLLLHIYIHTCTIIINFKKIGHNYYASYFSFMNFSYSMCILYVYIINM